MMTKVSKLIMYVLAPTLIWWNINIILNLKTLDVKMFHFIYLSKDDKLYQSAVPVSEKLGLMKFLPGDVYNVPLHWCI